MILNNISLINFKNYKQTDLDFVSRINCFIGNNGVGKTNMLDAVYYLSMCKSYFNSLETLNINHEEEFFVLQAEYTIKEKTENIYCGLKKGKKKVVKRNNKEYQKIAEHIGLLPVVMISPSDSSLILDGGEERRKYLNGVISQYDRNYLDAVIRYNKALVQRNQLLKDFAKKGTFDSFTLEAFDEQLIVSGEYIYKCRNEFTEKLMPVFQHYYDFVSGSNEKVNLSYKSHLHETDFRELLRENQGKDRMIQHTSSGIHKDDLAMELESYPIKKIGSQGQQKTFLIALKLAQFDFIKEISQKVPILLLDDIFDKLDAERVQKFIQLVAENQFGQIFITDANKQRLDSILEQLDVESKLFEVKDAQINEVK